MYDTGTAISFLLEQTGFSTEIVILQIHLGIVHYIGDCEMKVPARRNMKGITSLVVIDNIREVFQQLHRLFYIIEREIHVMGIV